MLRCLLDPARIQKYFEVVNGVGVICRGLTELHQYVLLEEDITLV
jgi:hypothetical protein